MRPALPVRRRFRVLGIEPFVGFLLAGLLGAAAGIVDVGAERQDSSALPRAADRLRIGVFYFDEEVGRLYDFGRRGLANGCIGQADVESVVASNDRFLAVVRDAPSEQGHQDDVQQWLAEIKRLQAENQALHNASATFADLAERLNQRLQSERGFGTAVENPMQGATSAGRTGPVDCVPVQAKPLPGAQSPTPRCGPPWAAGR